VTDSPTASPRLAPLDEGEGIESGETRHEADHAARALADRQQGRFAFLANVSTLLASSLDQEPTVRHLLELAVPDLGDQCTLVLLGDSGASLRRTVVFGDPDLEKRIEEVERRLPLDLHRSHPLSWVLSHGQPLLIEAVVDSFLASLARDDQHLVLLRSMGLRSMMILPLCARKRTFGAMTFATSTSGRRYDDIELAFALDFTRRAAMAIDNARLYEQAQGALRERNRADAERERLLTLERKAREEAEEARRAREELLAIVAHDLRNPLGVIVMGATLLERVATPEELGRIGRRTKMIRQAAERMGTLIRDLLDAASIEAGGLSLEPRTHALSSLVGDAVEFFTPLAEQRSILLDKSLLCEDVSVVCDGERIQQVLANLLGNALKFTPEGGLCTVRAQVSDGDICIEVEDTGPGIPRDLLPHVFDRYRSGKRSAGGGTGLGLYIAKGIVEGHKGAIGVRSRAGVGTTFFFTLPARSPFTPAIPIPLSSGSGRGGPGPVSG
jgi:signal transduction histidine kinase